MELFIFLEIFKTHEKTTGAKILFNGVLRGKPFKRLNLTLEKNLGKGLYILKVADASINNEELKGHVISSKEVE